MPTFIESDVPNLPRVWLLLSGGIDSTACLSFYLKERYSVECIHIDYGQLGSKHEHAAVERVVLHYNVPLTVLRWSGNNDFKSGEIVGRNAFLLIGSLMEIGTQSGILATGIHAGTPYFDCSKTFIASLQAVVDGYCAGRVRLAAPFLEWSKLEVYEYCKFQDVPIDKTYSCEEGMTKECGECLSCLDRRALDAL